MQASAGHRNFTTATIRECEGMADAGLGDDLLLANEVLDASRLGRLVADGHRVTLAVDSEETVDAAVAGGVREVIIDVNVGLPRCGCAPEHAGPLAGHARWRGLGVRGVMGYEGHVMGLDDVAERSRGCKASMDLLLAAHEDVGGDLISAGGTGTYAINTWANEIQAGSYVLMDTAYGRQGLPFEQAVFVAATVISSAGSYAVADCGLKSLGMDHGNPSIAGSEVWFCSDEHVTFARSGDDGHAAAVGSRVLVVPAHVDPTVAYHERMHVVAGLDPDEPGAAEVLETWPVDLRGW
jgi:D-serine deaminase-like pyridoxal phosphate-dependent protein